MSNTEAGKIPCPLCKDGIGWICSIGSFLVIDNNPNPKAKAHYLCDGCDKRFSRTLSPTTEEFDPDKHLTPVHRDAFVDCMLDHPVNRILARMFLTKGDDES